MRLNGWSGLAAGVVACSFLVASEAKAGWHDENLVLLDGHWEAIPDDVWGTPHPPFDDRWTKNNATIVVLISALRESRLVDTIKSAFDQASFPERIRVGVVQQNDATDPDCIVALCEQRGKPLLPLHEIAQEYEAVPRFSNPLGCEEFDKVRVFRMDASEAAGPVFARAHQESLVEDEDFCMQIDAHTIFSKGWDVAMLGEWGATKNEFAVLTTYPTNYKDIGKNSNKHWEMPHICGVSMSKAGSISNHQAGAIANMNRPMIAPVWAAGLSFSRCHAERRVPNDINLRQVFSGEEYSRGARLWTSGYDFYSITRPIIGVYYGNEKKNKGSWKGNRQEMESSLSRIRTLLNMPGSDQSPEALAKLGRHGLGDRRTLDQYIEFSGIDPQRLVANDKCVVRYVPWELGGLRDSILAEDHHVLEAFQNSEEVVGKHDAPEKKLRSNNFRKDKIYSSPSKTEDFSSETAKPYDSQLAYKVSAGIVIFIVGVVGLKYMLPKRRLLQTKEV